MLEKSAFPQGKGGRGQGSWEEGTSPLENAVDGFVLTSASSGTARSHG